MKTYICPKCGKRMDDPELSTRFRCQYCKEFVDGWKEELHEQLSKVFPKKKAEEKPTVT